MCGVYSVSVYSVSVYSVSVYGVSVYGVSVYGVSVYAVCAIIYTYLFCMYMMWCALLSVIVCMHIFLQLCGHLALLSSAIVRAVF